MYEKIITLIENEYEVTWEDLIGKSRKQRSVVARFMLMYCLYKYCKWTQKTISELMLKERSSVCYGINIAKNYIESVKSNDNNSIYEMFFKNNIIDKIKELKNLN